MKVYLLGEHPSWNARNHADALMRRAPADIQLEWALWPPSLPTNGQAWHFDDADVVLNLGSCSQPLLWSLAQKRGFTGKIVCRFTTMLPRLQDRFVEMTRNSHAVLVESETCLALAKQLTNTPVVCCPTGVNLDVFRPSPILSSEQRPMRALWIAGTQGYCAERAGVKGQEVAAQLFPLLAQRHIAFDMRAVAPQNGKLMNRDEMRQWYNGGRVYVCTSKMEGVPNTALEAAACGCAVVSTPVGVMPELIRDGVNGYLVPQGSDPLAFAEAIDQACQRWVEMYNRADGILERIRRFSWDVLTEKWWAFLRGLAS